MPAPGNLADPDYEPTDEDLERLMRDAFAGIREAREESLRQMRERIARLSAEVLERLHAEWPGPPGT